MREKKLNFKNAEVRYRIENEEGRPTIFMLHAAFADHGLFEDQVADFGSDCRIVLIDLPGHGANRSLPASVSRSGSAFCLTCSPVSGSIKRSSWGRTDR